MSAPVKVKGSWRPLIDYAKSVTALAVIFDVSRSTLNRWIRGQAHPSKLTIRAVRDWCRKRKLAPPW